MRVEVVFNRAHEIGHRRKVATTNSLVGDLAEPAFDEVEPRVRGRGEVQMKPGVLGEPALHVGMLVVGVVLADQVNLDCVGHFAVVLAQELQELFVTVSRSALTDHGAGAGEGGEARGGAVALVVVGHGSAQPFFIRSEGWVLSSA